MSTFDNQDSLSLSHSLVTLLQHGGQLLHLCILLEPPSQTLYLSTQRFILSLKVIWQDRQTVTHWSPYCSQRLTQLNSWEAICTEIIIIMLTQTKTNLSYCLKYESRTVYAQEQPLLHTDKLTLHALFKLLPYRRYIYIYVPYRRRQSVQIYTYIYMHLFKAVMLISM